VENGDARHSLSGFAVVEPSRRETSRPGPRAAPRQQPPRAETRGVGSVCRHGLGNGLRSLLAFAVTAREGRLGRGVRYNKETRS